MRVTLPIILFVLWTNVGVIFGTILRSVGDWTLHRSQITCSGVEGGVCNYHFLLLDRVVYKHHVCSFQTPRVDPDHPDSMEFQDVVCGDNDTFRVSGSWDTNGNINLSFTNIVERLWAFYAYDRWEVEGGRIGPDKDSPTYPVGVFERKRDMQAKKNMGWGVGSHVASPKPCNWTVEWLNRCKLASHSIPQAPIGIFSNTEH